MRPPNRTEQELKKLCFEQLEIDRQKLLLKQPFVGMIIMRLELVPVCDSRLNSMATDGENIFIDVNFYAKLNHDERLFCLAHEVWHNVLLHFARRQKRDIKLFNIAADLEIHFTLLQENMKEPFVLPHKSAWATLSAEAIYEELQKDPAYKPTPKTNGNMVWENNNGSFDEHITPETTLQEPQDGDIIDPDYTPSFSADIVEKIRSRVICTVQQIERIQGSIPNNLKKIVEKLTTPQLKWQELLAQFVTSCYGGSRRWLPPTRRYVYQGLYLPSLRMEELNAVVAIDTSGSTIYHLPQFFAELSSLLKTFGRYNLTVIQCDKKVQKVENFSDAFPLKPNYKFEVKGLGGTSFNPPFEYIAKERIATSLFIYLTDGYGDAPIKAPSFPVLWIIANDGIKCANWGRTIFLKGEYK